MADITKLGFYSELNYMKRSITGSGTISTATITTATIDHNLNYIPQYEIGVDISVDGVIWVGGKVSELTDQGILSGLGSPPTYIEVDSWVTTTQLIISLSNTASQIVPYYYTIYLDYAT